MTGRAQPGRLLPFAKVETTGPGRPRVAGVEVWFQGRAYVVQLAPDPMNPKATSDGQPIDWSQVPSLVRATALHSAGYYHAGGMDPFPQKQEGDHG